MNRQNQQQIALPSVSDMGAIVARGAVNFAKRHKVISGSYIVGIFFLLLIGSGTKLSMDQTREYNRIMNTIDLEAEYTASNRLAQATQAYRGESISFTYIHCVQLTCAC